MEYSKVAKRDVELKPNPTIPLNNNIKTEYKNDFIFWFSKHDIQMLITKILLKTINNKSFDNDWL